MLGLSEHPGETERPQSSAFLLIDSQDRHQVSQLQAPFSGVAVIRLANTTQPLNDFTIQKRQPFLSGYFTRIAVTEVRFEFNSPNVNVRNNKFQVVGAAGGFGTTITLIESFYTPEELATEVDAELTAAFPAQTWDVVYQNNKFTITSNDNFTIAPFYYPTVEQTLSGVFYMMGFNTAINSTLATAHQGAFFPNMCYTRYIDICSRQLTQYQKVKDNSTRENPTPAVLCRLYLGNYCNEGVGAGDSSARSIWPGCAPAVIQRIYNVPKYSSWNPGAFVDQIDIQLRDDAGNLLYIPGNDVASELQNARNTPQNFQLTLHVTES